MFNSILDAVNGKTPLVHNITNYVTVNDCANIILASGGAPIMADDIGEAAEITGICSSLVLNIGTLNARTIESMLAAGKQANALNHPIILDPVGAGASKLRNETALKLIEDLQFAVIRGNISEIKFLATGGGKTQGVDASEADKVTEETLDDVIRFAKALSEKTGAVIAITGAIDIVSDAHKAYVIYNGHALMSRVTGTGCMLTAVIGAYVGANPDAVLDATASAVMAMGLSGELAYQRLTEIDGGTNSYRMLLIDFMSKLNAAALEAGARYDIK